MFCANDDNNSLVDLLSTGDGVEEEEKEEDNEEGRFQWKQWWQMIYSYRMKPMRGWVAAAMKTAF